MDPLLLDIPEQLETDRLVIRTARPGDGKELNAAIAESIGSLRPWMPWAQNVPSVQDSEIHCRKKYAEYLGRQDMQMLLFLKSSSILVGSSGLHRIDWSIPKFEIGYWVRSSFYGKGFITEAVRAITAFAFNNLNARRIEIRTDDLNVRSNQVAERCGYALEGVLKNFGLNARDTLYHLRIYSKTSA